MPGVSLNIALTLPPQRSEVCSFSPRGGVLRGVGAQQAVQLRDPNPGLWPPCHPLPNLRTLFQSKLLCEEREASCTLYQMQVVTKLPRSESIFAACNDFSTAPRQVPGDNVPSEGTGPSSHTGAPARSTADDSTPAGARKQAALLTSFLQVLP